MIWGRIDPVVGLVKMHEVIKSGDEVGLSNPDISYPLTFHPVVVSIDAQRTGLDLPDKFWELIQLKPGMHLQVTKVEGKCMYYIEGEVEKMDGAHSPQLVLKHQPNMLRAQRRLFYRFNLKKKFTLTAVTFPDGKSLPSLQASLSDMSPGGIGFKTSVPLPSGTRFEVDELFESPVPEMENLYFFVETVWCRGSKWLGYRCGAVFKFPSEYEQDSFSRVLNQLHINRLAWYYHRLVKG
ncbi:PilZ domain-containing protein [candidate division FCPU426 bacterium]|nr:PilZ domain-containing protein [candidate division FCPU426 bacterium]